MLLVVRTNNMVKQLIFATRIPGHVQPVGRPCGTVDTLCYEGCEGHGSANGLPQPRMELAKTMNRPIWASIVDGVKLF